MRGKYLTKVVRHFREEKRRRAAALLDAGARYCTQLYIFVLMGFSFAVFSWQVFGEEANSIAAPKFVGSQSCSSSSCHGGASEKSNQYTIWSTHDFHHARPYATLETARSERLAEVLKIGNPTQSARCTVCHAPFQTVPADRLGPDAKATEGVSCETCHGPAENWIRSHTRPDYTHADRVAAGMRDLKNLYVRANTCVACHQNIDPEIRAAGHPELIFEMDGQCVTMPRHWPKAEDAPGPQAWLVGQAVALREMTWQLAPEELHAPETPLHFSDTNLVNRWMGLSWVLHNIRFLSNSLPPGRLANDITYVQEPSDQLAREAAEIGWSDDTTRKALAPLANTASDFANAAIPQAVQARRAERLVLALDRLTLGLNGAATNSAVNASLDKLFNDAQSLPDFNPQQFAKDLNTFHSSVAGILETK